MIVVLGRPALDDHGALTGTAALVAVTATAAGARVELVGAAGDDAATDAAVVELGRAGVGHAALLRIPSLARPLDAADVELALRYVPDCRVLIVAEELSEAALDAALEGVAFHAAQLIILRDAGAAAPEGLPETATLLEQPDEDGGAFSRLVGRYAALLDAGQAPAAAWQEALGETGWEQAPA